MSETLFFRCESCGNFVMFVSEKSACTPRCCGEPMMQLEPNTTDGAKEKHVPMVTVDGNTVFVQVGSVLHPMTEAHSIRFIYLETKRGGQICYLSPADEPKAVFCVADGDEPTAVYEYCNLHGLWKKDLKEAEKEPSKVLVTYFTTGGVTKAVAETIAKVTGGDLFELEPKDHYTEADLDWTDRNSRSNQEMNDGAERPRLAHSLPNADRYETVFVGFPIWWGKAPKIVYTFFDSTDLKGKRIIPYCTSGGTKSAMADRDVRAHAPAGAEVAECRLLNGKPSEEEIASWLKELGF